MANFDAKELDGMLLKPSAYSVGKIIPSNTIEIGIGWPNIKSRLKIGNMVIHNTHHFNWFQRNMWKLFFGFEIENIKEN